MKAKSIFAATLLVAGAAFADSTTVATDYVLGVMPVSASGKTQVILSVPWVAEGSSADAAVTVTNLVKTAGLSDGDKLTWYNPSTSKYMAWEVETDGAAVPYWKPVTTVNDNSTIPSLGEDISRGEAIVLTRAGTSNTIYVIGQVGTTSTATITIPAGSAGKWQLLAPPCASTSEVDFNNCATFEGALEGDMITVDGVNYYTYMNVGTTETEYKWTRSKYAVSHTAMIPAGRGFWYKRYKDNNDALVITWNNVPSAN